MTPQTSRVFPGRAAFAALFALAAATAPAKPPATPDANAAGGLTNAALVAYGTQITYQGSATANKNRDSAPEFLQDGNPHSRVTVTGVPYTFVVELPVRLLIEKISFSQSDYANEAAPKDIEIVFDDGQSIKRTLDPTHPVKVKGPVQPLWQDVPVGREIKTARVTVLTVTEGTVNYGGLGDIALWTRANVADVIRGGTPAETADTPPDAAGKESAAPLVPPPGYAPNAPTYIHASSPVAAGGNAPAKVNLPSASAPDEYPRLLFTPKELADFHHLLDTTEYGKAAMASFMKRADEALKAPLVYPSPEDTAANKPAANAGHYANSYHVQYFGFAYALTGDEKYAQAARDILVGYGERYSGYPRHSGRNKNDSSKIAFQRLSEAMWLIPMLEGYDYIYRSQSLSDADRKLIADGLLRPAIAEIRHQEPSAEVAGRDKKTPGWRTATPENATEGHYPNWLNFYSTATLMVGSLLADQAMIDLAAADFRTAIAEGIGADGMWGEGAIGYQLFAMGVMCPGFDVAAHLGIDLWSASGGRFKQLFDSPLLYAYPDATMPGINDSGRGKLEGWQSMVYHYGFLRYGDPRYAFPVNAATRQLQASEGLYFPARIFEDLPQPAAIRSGSVLFGSLGYSILRDDTKYALMDSGPHGGTHGHDDKLNLILFFAPAPGSKGDEMGGEPVMHSYADPLHNEWTVKSIAHNTMSVDGRSQAHSTGRMLVFEDTPEVKVMRAEATACYPNVMLDRTVVTTPTAVIDLCYGKSTTPHTWDRTLRYQGTLDGLPADAPVVGPLGADNGYQHIKVVRQQPAAEGWTGTWQTTVGAFTATLAGAPGQEVFTGFDPDKAAMAVARQKGVGADFAAVYALPAWQNGVVATRWLPETPEANGAKAFEIRQPDGTTTQVIVAHRPGEWTTAGWTSDARVLYVHTKGDAVQVLLAGGKLARHDAHELRQDAAGNYLARIQDGKFTLVSGWKPGEGGTTPR